LAKSDRLLAVRPAQHPGYVDVDPALPSAASAVARHLIECLAPA